MIASYLVFKERNETEFAVVQRLLYAVNDFAKNFSFFAEESKTGVSSSSFVAEPKFGTGSLNRETGICSKCFSNASAGIKFF